MGEKGYLTSLEQIQEGKDFPTSGICDRLSELHDYKELYEGEQAEVYKEQFKRVGKIQEPWVNEVTYETVINYQKKISDKVVELLLGEVPTLNAGVGKIVEQASIDLIIENTDLWNTLPQAIIDVTRYGDAVLQIYEENGHGQIDVIPTEYWIPIVDSNNIKKTLNHVIFRIFDNGGTAGTYKEYVQFIVHYKGYYETYVHELSKGKIAKLVKPMTITQTGLTDFAIIVISNVTTSDKVFGQSDYKDINPIASEILVRTAQINKVLDKHTDPSISAPSSAFDRDTMTGEKFLKMGDAFENDGGKVEYVTWEANLKENREQRDFLKQELYSQSGLGGLFMGNEIEKLGGNISGVALKRLAMNATSKITKLQSRVRNPLIKALKLTSELGGVGITNLQGTPVTITFGDPLPLSDLERAEIAAAFTGNKQIMSQSTAMENYTDLSDKQCKEELLKIAAEQSIVVKPI